MNATDISYLNDSNFKTDKITLRVSIDDATSIWRTVANANGTFLFIT